MKSPEVTIRQVSMEWLGMKKLVVKQSTTRSMNLL